MLSVIIPALNESDNIERAVRSAVIGGADEVLVVDGGSRDATMDRAASSGARVLTAAPGRARQMNAGVAAAQGDALLFLHADNWLSLDALHQVRRELDDPAAGCGALKQRIEAPGLRYRLLEQGNAARVRYLGLPYGDQAIFVRRSLFEQSGGYADVRLLEDLILMRALRRRSWPRLLPGPVHVSARRWQQRGVIRQTARNWLLLSAWFVGVSPNRLAEFYYGPSQSAKEAS